MTTPTDLAHELGISPKSLRAWFRKKYPRQSYVSRSEWEITPEMAEAARAHFGGSRRMDSAFSKKGEKRS